MAIQEVNSLNALNKSQAAQGSREAQAPPEENKSTRKQDFVELSREALAQVEADRAQKNQERRAQEIEERAILTQSKGDTQQLAVTQERRKVDLTA